MSETITEKRDQERPPRLDLTAADTLTAQRLAERVIELSARLIDDRPWDAFDQRAGRKGWTEVERAEELAAELMAGRRMTATTLAAESIMRALHQVDWAQLALYRHGECDVWAGDGEECDGAAVFDLDGQPFCLIAPETCVGDKAGALERAAEICAALNLMAVLGWVERHGRLAQAPKGDE